MNKYTQFLLLSNKKIYDGGTKRAFFDRKSAVCPRITVFLFTRRRSDFTRRQAHFTLRSNISPTRRVDFVEKSTSEEVLFSGAGGGTRFARLRALGRSRSQQSTGLLLCAARPSSPTHAFRIKKGTADAIPFLLVPVVGLEPTRCRHQRILSPSRLPIPSHRRINFFIIAHRAVKIKKKFCILSQKEAIYRLLT